MNAMRQKVVHDYFGVDEDIVWQVVTGDLPRSRSLGRRPKGILDRASTAPLPTLPVAVYGGGRFLLYLNRKGTFYSLPLTGGEHKPTTLYETDFSKEMPRVSPNGRWVAYQTNQSGRNEIWKAAFPTFADQSKLSKSGGMQPLWSKDGRELYFLTPEGKMMVVEVKDGPTLETRLPKELYSTRLRPTSNVYQYAVAIDGRFLIAEPVNEPSKPITVVVNWTAEVQPKPR